MVSHILHDPEISCSPAKYKFIFQEIEPEVSEEPEVEPEAESVESTVVIESENVESSAAQNWDHA